MQRLYSFYSILVRLKVTYFERRDLDYKFLFHTGSIKRLKAAFEHETVSQASFYSILVRLKASRLFVSIPESVVFLFHTGSIKRREKHAIVQLEIPMFLFHTGSIKSSRDWEEPPGSLGFLFHTGSIKSGYVP